MFLFIDYLLHFDNYCYHNHRQPYIRKHMVEEGTKVLRIQLVHHTVVVLAVHTVAAPLVDTVAPPPPRG